MLLYGLILLIAVAAAFENPSRAALLPTLVPREIFPRAVTVATTNQALAFASGPALGGLLIAARGIAAVYAAYIVLVCCALASLAFVRPERSDGPRGAPTLRAMREGLVFVRRRPVVLGCMVLDMFAVIFGGAAALLPIYARDILQVGARGYGLLTASLEIGALVTSAILVMRRPIRRTGRALLLAVGVYGLATIAFGLSRWFPLSVAAYMLVGMADQVSVVMRSTAIQLSTPDELRGRVSAVNLLFIGASNQLGRGGVRLRRRPHQRAVRRRERRRRMPGGAGDRGGDDSRAAGLPHRRDGVSAGDASEPCGPVPGRLASALSSARASSVA